MEQNTYKYKPINPIYVYQYTLEDNHYQEYKNLSKKTKDILFTENIDYPIDIMFNTILHQAIINNNMKLFTFILNKNASIEKSNLFGDTPFHTAVKLKRYLMIDILNSMKFNHKIKNIANESVIDIFNYEILDETGVKLSDFL